MKCLQNKTKPECGLVIYFLNAQLRIIAFNKQFDSIIPISDNAIFGSILARLRKIISQGQTKTHKLQHALSRSFCEILTSVDKSLCVL